MAMYKLEKQKCQWSNRTECKGPRNQRAEFKSSDVHKQEKMGVPAQEQRANSPFIYLLAHFRYLRTG